VAVQSDSSEKAWSSTTAPLKAYEAALANEIAEAKKNKKTPQPLAQDRPLTLETLNDEEAKSPLKSRRTNDGADEVGALGSEDSAADGVQKRREVVLDTDAIMTTLASNVLVGSDYRVDIVDFGGQNIFGCLLNIFFSLFAVFELVFDMSWLVSPDASVRNYHKRVLKRWLNSIVVHTARESADGSGLTMSPIFIVGTHKDVVSSPALHLQISNTIADMFRGHVAWKFIVPYVVTGKDGQAVSRLNFFPIDNSLGRSDPVVLSLLRSLEIALGVPSQ
jgi:hypothetical protein